MTRPYAEVIGDPIAQSKSPRIHGFWLDKLGLEGEYHACHVRSDELAGYFASRRADPAWRGCNITIPHKERVIPFVDRMHELAARIGATNTVFRDADGGLAATNTDVDGIREALRGTDPAGQVVAVIGAGGAARAAFACLETLNCREVRVIARNEAKAHAVLDDFDLPARTLPLDPGCAMLDDAVLVINATQLGMTGQPPMPEYLLDQLARTAPECLVFDMVYAPLQTPLLNRAGALGRATSHGLTMLVGQARTAFARFFGANPDPAWDEELFKVLTR